MSAIVDLAQFRKDMAAALIRVNQEGTRIQRKVALATLTTAVMATPVDTGRARANWNTAMEDADRTDRGTPGSAGQGSADAIARGSQAIGRAKLGSTIVISNSLPYIERLNDGYSKQAPAGFVEKAIQQAVDAVNKEKIDV